MEETYVVIGTKIDKKEQDTLYAGQDKVFAFNINIDLPYKVLYLQVWLKGVMIRRYIKNDVWRWTLEFDRLKKLDEELTLKKSELKKIEDDIDFLKSLKG